jgi:mannosyltransferase OCH1-like enzyme
MIIPKIIWQTHEYEYEDLPEIYKRNSNLWKSNTEGWEYKYHSVKDRRNFIEIEFPEYLYLYDHIVPSIYKSDFWRYLILYRHGGIYSDMDSVLKIDINSEECKKLINFNASINVASNFAKEGYNICCIIAAPNDKILLKVIESMIDKCKRLYLEFPEPGSMIGSMWINATGPIMYSEVITNNINEVYLSKMPVRHDDSLKSAEDLNRKHFKGGWDAAGICHI